MCAQNTPDHWAKLLSEMGVQPLPQKPEPVSEPPKEEGVVEVLDGQTLAAEPPVVSEPSVLPAPVVKPLERARPISDWDRLAQELGIPVAPRPSKPAEPQAKETESVQVEVHEKVEPSPGQPDEQEEVEPSAALKEWEDEMVELTDPLFLDNVAPNEEESLAGEESASEKSEESEDPSERKAKSGRRRRRRRRGRRLPETETTEAEVQEADLEAASDTVDLLDVEAESSSQASEGESPASGEEAADPTSGRRKRHRRRRPRKKSAAGSEAGSECTSEAGSSTSSEEGEPTEEWGSADESSDEDADLDEDSQSSRLSHRAIPTWEEAIQLVVAHNVESRSKHPNAGSGSRGRTHRRSREKPSGK